ncbi:MAG TPA: ribonuclease HII [Saprospiraceae bacterium]|nr:ribonuclease HII [Saprospiraceae bacterium]
MKQLFKYYKNLSYEVGCDEAGRGCLAGPVVGAAVMLDPKIEIIGLKDSKKLSEQARNCLRTEIESKAMCWSVFMVHADEIDRINILQASLKAMHQAVLDLPRKASLVLIDGNKLLPDSALEQIAIIKGDGLYQSIAAASILAKTHRDEFMSGLSEEYPQYGWEQNKAYPTIYHRRMIRIHGLSPYHRKTYRISHA